MDMQIEDLKPGSRYVFEALRGKGSYGLVGEFLDTKTGKHVAIKRMHKIEDTIDAKRTLREIMVMNYFRHENILNLNKVIINENRDIYLVTSLMDSDLNRIIKKSLNELTETHIQYIFYQIFRALQFLHSGNIIHRDIKPSNILANEECEIVLCDFGFAREADSFAQMTEYVVTRFYRAPEVMLSSQKYSKAVDIWSTGCTLYEIITGVPLFQAKDYLDLIKKFIQVLGKPSETELEFIKNEKGYNYIVAMPDTPRRKVSSLLQDKKCNPDLLDLLDRCLEFHPDRRITSEEALRHPFFASLFDEKDIISFKQQVDFSFETKENISLDELHTKVQQMANHINQMSE